jgi:hypothetical protein
LCFHKKADYNKNRKRINRPRLIKRILDTEKRRISIFDINDKLFNYWRVSKTYETFSSVIQLFQKGVFLSESENIERSAKPKHGNLKFIDLFIRTDF